MPLLSVCWRLLHGVPGRFIRVKHHCYTNSAALLGGSPVGAQRPLNATGELASPALIHAPIFSLAWWCPPGRDAPVPLPSATRGFRTAHTATATANETEQEAWMEGGGMNASEPLPREPAGAANWTAEAGEQRGTPEASPLWTRIACLLNTVPSGKPSSDTVSENKQVSGPLTEEETRQRQQVTKLMEGANRAKGPVSERARPQDKALLKLWAHLRDGRAEQAQRGLRAWVESANGVTIKAFNYLLKACATGVQIELGYHVYASMLESGVPPDVRSVGWMLRMLIRAGQVDEALSWLSAARASLPSMESRELGVLMPPTYFLNVCLEECIMRKDWAAAGHCADQLGSLGMDDRTFRLLLQIAGLEQRPAAVALTWTGLQAAGVTPTLEQRLTHIQALARCNLLEQAGRELRVLGGIIAQGGADSGGGETQDSSGSPRSEDRANLAEDANGGVRSAGGEWGGFSDGAARDSGEQSGLWWSAPPPRDTSKNALATLHVAYNTVMAAAARAEDVDEARALFAEMRRADLQPDLYTYNALLHAMATVQDVDGTLRVYRSMQAGGILPNEHTVGALLTAFVQVGRLKEGAQMLSDATTSPHNASAARAYTIAYNILLNACAKEGETQLAVRVFGQMKSQRVPPDSATYLGLFEAFDCGPRSIVRLKLHHATAEEREAERDNASTVLMLEEDMRDNGVEHTAATRAALLRALGPSSLHLLQDCIRRAKRAHATGAAPLNATFFVAAIHVYAQSKQLSAALSLLNDMAAMGVAPTTMVFNAALNCCAEARDMGQGLRLADRMLRDGPPANTITVNTIIKLCCYGHPYQAALPLLFRMEAAGVTTNTASYNPLLRAAVIARDVATFELLVERMKRRGVLPDGDTCLAAVGAYLQQKKPDVAAEALDALTARMFGHGGSVLAAERDAEQKVHPSANTTGGPGEGRDEGGADSEEGPEMSGSDDKWEFLADSGAPEVAVEEAETAALLREAALFPSPEARAKFLARMVGVSGGGFEGAAPQWEERAIQQREVDWNSWAHRVRRQYDERRASRRWKLENEQTL